MILAELDLQVGEDYDPVQVQVLLPRQVSEEVQPPEGRCAALFPRRVPHSS